MIKQTVCSLLLVVVSAILSGCAGVPLPGRTTFQPTDTGGGPYFHYIVDSSYFHIPNSNLQAVVAEQGATLPQVWGRYLVNREGGARRTTTSGVFGI
jgi:hypothetical protein